MVFYSFGCAFLKVMNISGSSQAGFNVRKIADWLFQAGKVVVFTGAGISTESGIPDFRSPGGLWSRFDPEEFLFHKFLSSRQTRENYWNMQKEFWPSIKAAMPNKAHVAIAELDIIGKLDCVITQNIDGLHQRAGVPENKVLELHGTMAKVACLSCGDRSDREDVENRLSKEKAPLCLKCGGLLKPATISFGQAMPLDVVSEAEQRSSHCELFLVIGSSLVVYPAAEMPAIAKRAGVRLVILNDSPTPYDGMADMVLRGKAGPVMEDIMASLQTLTK